MKSCFGLRLVVNFGRVTGFTPCSTHLVSLWAQLVLGEHGGRRVGRCKFTPWTKVGHEPRSALASIS